MFSLLSFLISKELHEFEFAFFTLHFSWSTGSIFYIGYINESFDWDFLFINMFIKNYKYKGINL
jgi:hypothetical protein